MFKPTMPKHFVAFDPSDKEFWFRADYDPGEDQWFDAWAGVGSPGYPACAEVYEVSFDHGKTWESPEAYPQLNIDALEQIVHERAQEEAESFYAGLAERDEL